ncbi:MAG: hypothetical protein ACLRVB_07835 [Blautia sp.]
MSVQTKKSKFQAGTVTAGTRFESDDVRKFAPQFATENTQISIAWILHKYPML